MMQDFPHLVIPGQIIAVSTSSEDSFLRGHGTYIDDRPAAATSTDTTSTPTTTTTLRAACLGTVVRVNQLIAVESVALHSYTAHAGDLVVGRIASVGGHSGNSGGNARWTVALGGGRPGAALPLSGVHVPGAAQRVRTAADVRDMRRILREGDLVSCEIHKVMSGSNSSVMLHTRSVRYGKLENGAVLAVPAGLVPRRKTHYTAIVDNQFQILLGCNGMIWMQRNNNNNNRGGDGGSAAAAAGTTATTTGGGGGGQQELSEAEEQRRLIHAATPYGRDDRAGLARLRNSVQCLRLTLSEITPDSVERVYRSSEPYAVADMLLPATVLRITACLRRSS